MKFCNVHYGHDIVCCPTFVVRKSRSRKVGQEKLKRHDKVLIYGTFIPVLIEKFCGNLLENLYRIFEIFHEFSPIESDS